MTTHTFTSGRVRRIDYDPGSQQLDIQWDNKSISAYKHVPQEVVRRLCSAPNPATYWEDRIAEEYPKAAPRVAKAVSEAAQQLKSLFGSGKI